MSDHAGDPGIDELLRDGGADLGIGLIVMGHQIERGVLAVDLDFRPVRLFHREPRPVLVVLAEVSDAPGKGSGASDGDADRGFCRGLGLLVFAAAGKGRHGCDRDDAEIGADHGYLRIKTPRKRLPDYADPPRGCQFDAAAVRRGKPSGVDGSKKGRRQRRPLHKPNPPTSPSGCTSRASSPRRRRRSRWAAWERRPIHRSILP